MANLQEITLKQLNLMGERFVGQHVSVRGAQFQSAEPTTLDNEPYFALTLDQDDTLSSNLFAEKADFAELILNTSVGDWVDVDGVVVKFDDGTYALNIDEMTVNGDEESNDDAEDEAEFEAIDVTEKVMLMDEFADRLAVTLDGVSAFVESSDDAEVVIRGELKPRNGNQIPFDISVVATAYDSSNRVIGTQFATILAASFFGFEAFELRLETSVADLNQVRVYPKKA